MGDTKNEVAEQFGELASRMRELLVQVRDLTDRADEAVEAEDFTSFVRILRQASIRCSAVAVLSAAVATECELLGMCDLLGLSFQVGRGRRWPS
jgi:hypothetical protein